MAVVPTGAPPPPPPEEGFLYPAAADTTVTPGLNATPFTATPLGATQAPFRKVSFTPDPKTPDPLSSDHDAVPAASTKDRTTDMYSTTWQTTALKVAFFVVGLAAIGFLAFTLAGEVSGIKGLEQATIPHDLEVLNAAVLGSAIPITVGLGAGIDLAITFRRWRVEEAKEKAAQARDNEDIDSDEDESRGNSFSETKPSQEVSTNTDSGTQVYGDLSQPKGENSDNFPERDGKEYHDEF